MREDINYIRNEIKEMLNGINSIKILEYIYFTIKGIKKSSYAAFFIALREVDQLFYWLFFYFYHLVLNTYK